MSRNHPDKPDDPLLAAAIRILSNEQHSFLIKPWREFMPKAQATEKKVAMKAAAAKMAKKGVVKPQHSPSGFPTNPYKTVDSVSSGVVESDQGVNPDVQHQTEGTTMTAGTDGVAKAAQMKADEAARKAAAKAAALEAKTQAAEKKALEAAAKKEATAKKKQEAAASKEAAKANKTPRERTYTGSMLSLAERQASGAYTKGVNGQLRSNDEVALALESIPAKKMVPFLLSVLQLPTNPYPQLNYGQQSMNLRNRLRGVLKAGQIVLVPGTKATKDVAAVEALVSPLTVDLVKELRDSGGWTAQTEAEAA